MHGKGAIVIGVVKFGIVELIPGNAAYFCRCFDTVFKIKSFEIINFQKFGDSTSSEKLSFKVRFNAGNDLVCSS